MIDIRNVYSVTQVNSYIKNMFKQDYLLQTVLVKGEVSNCKYHASGHIYFTIKDSGGVLNCVMFSGNRNGLKFNLEAGQQIIVGGTVDVYERDGKYQMYARQIVLDGAGLLYEKFEHLKRELEELGMFAQEYKQQIPKYIRTLGVVTADTGAAVRDIIQITRRRNPYVQIILYPAIVQGEAAAESIVKGIRALEAMKVDVMIVGRGGGSMEDLWAFNERIVAQAVFDCTVPVISAVGHETDTTIIDFVADLRAPTPSAAAELAIYDIRLLSDTMADYQSQLEKLMRRQLMDKREQIRHYEMQLKYLSPTSRIRDKKSYALSLEQRMQERIQRVIDEKRYGLALYIEKMRRLSPLEKLNSGYSYVEDVGGKNIRSVSQVGIGDDLTIRVSDGTIKAEVKNVEAITQN